MKSRGYSLIEAIVAIAVFAVVMVGFLTVFDNSTKVSKVQTAISGAQENLRAVMTYMTRYARMAGSGGLPVVNRTTLAPQAVIVSEVAATGGTDLTSGYRLVPQSDVLELWGSFLNPMFDIAPASYSYDDTSKSGSFQVPDLSTVTGQAQDKTELKANIALTSGNTPALLVSVQRITFALDPELGTGTPHYRPMNQIGAAILKTDSDPTFGFAAAASSSSGVGSFNPGGVFPNGMTDVARVAILNGYRFFVAYESGTSVPTLYVTNILTSTTEPVASDVVDLQVALGCDRYANGQLTEVGANPNDDQWLFNVAGESNADKFNSASVPLLAYLTMLRLTVVTRAPAADMEYIQPSMGGAGKAIPNEDGRDILADPPFMGQPASHYRYRALTEHVKLRALTPIL